MKHGSIFNKLIPWVGMAATLLSLGTAFLPVRAQTLPDSSTADQTQSPAADEPSVTISQPTGAFASVPDALEKIFNLIITVASVAFVVLFLVGGLQYLTSTGDPEATTKAKQTIVNAIVGLVIVLAAWAVSNFILGKLAPPIPLK